MTQKSPKVDKTAPRQAAAKPDTVVHALRQPLSGVQIAASAFAAVCAAFLASFFGVAGTLIGAAVTSVVATIASALYGNWLTRSRAAVKRQAAALSGRMTIPAAPPAVTGFKAKLKAKQGAIVVGVGGAVAAFALAIIVITLIESAAGAPLSKVVEGKKGSGTTLSQIAGGPATASPKATPRPSPSATPTPSASASITPSSTVTSAPSSVSPTPSVSASLTSAAPAPGVPPTP